MSNCIDCITLDRENEQNKIDAAIARANIEAKEQGHTYYAIVQRVNGSGYMWRVPSDPDCKRLPLIGYYTVS